MDWGYNMNLFKEIETLGFNTRQFEDTICVTTPQTFASGDPVSFYILRQHEQLILDDYGVNLHSLELSLPNPGQSKKIISNILSKFDNKIEFNGYNFFRRAEVFEKTDALAEFLSLFSYLTNYKPKTTVEINRDLILEDIFSYLKKNHDEVTYDYHINGISGSEYVFDFLADDVLLDFTSSHHSATGSLLRKIHDVHNLVQYDYKFEVVIDDRNNKKSIQEAKILSSVAKVVPLSNIQTAA